MDYVVNTTKPLSPAQWEQLIGFILERWRQIDNFVTKGRTIPVRLRDGEFEAYENGPLGMIRWVAEDPLRGGPEVAAMLKGCSLAVGIRPVAKVNYEPYAR